ncbi:T9SS type A sorting domain-containing protein [bacterium SCSIO 12741]|nr:T9SS type A sorting domain-containing protein [bacterium SCSIO 12741]
MKSFFFTLFAISLTQLALAQLNDAELSQIDGNFCDGQQTLTATLNNSGSNSLQSVSIAWAVSTNGGAYVTQSPVSLTPSLASGGQTTVTLGSFSYSPGDQYAVKAYSFNPNGVSDSDPSNDTSNTSGTARLNGTYTLGGSSSDFTTWKSLETALNSWGVCGPVRIEVRQGVYQEQIHFNAIPGSSASNPIKIVGAPGNTASAKLTNYAPNVSDNYTLKLQNLSHITLDSLSFEATNANFGRVIVFSGTVHHITISNDSLLGTPATNVGSDQAIIHDGGGKLDQSAYTRIENNYFRKGNFGVYFVGGKYSKQDSNNVVINNTFEDYVNSGVFFSHQRGGSIEDNYCYSSQKNGFSPSGIYCGDSDTFSILRNKIIVDGYQSVGISVARCNGFPNHPVTIANNSVSIVGSSVYFTYGMMAYDGSYNRFVYNSVLVASGGRWSAAMVIDMKTGSHGTILNNSFVNLRRGYALDARNSAGLDTSDFNNLYTNGFNLGHHTNQLYTNYIPDLSSYQNLIGQEANSFVAYPGFKSQTDLKTKSSQLDEAAIPIPGITADILNTQRHVLTPDIGAYEFVRAANDIAIIDLISPFNKGCGHPNLPLIAVVKNVGKNTQNNIKVGATVSGITTGTFLDSVTTLKPDETDTLLLGTLSTAPGGVVNVSVYSQLANDFDRSDDTLAVDSINLLPHPSTPIVPSVITCAHNDTFLVALGTTAKTRWFADSANTIIVHEGDTFPIPNPTQNDTFYVEAYNEIKTRVGPKDFYIGAYLYESDVANGYEFDAHTDIILDSVTFFPQDTAGTIHVEVTFGTQIIDSITIPYSGYNPLFGLKVQLDLEIPEGLGYLITAKGSSCGGLRRNTDGFKYPYTESKNMMTITKGSNTITCRPFGSFNFFYDMVVKKEGCVQQEQAKAYLLVKPAPDATLNPIPGVCEGGSPFALVQGSVIPSGISTHYFGPGVINGQFDPVLAGPGKHKVGYTAYLNGCTDTAFQMVRVNRLPFVLLQILDDLCEDDAPYTLRTGGPFGGTYSGPGVTGNQFNPSSTGPGTFDLIYEYTDTNNCTAADTSAMVVHASPQVQVGAIQDLCESSDSLALNSGTPVGGLYSGQGVVNNWFYPSKSGVGTHSIQYSFTDTNQCSGQANGSVKVSADPQFDLGPDTTTCMNASITLHAPLQGMRYQWSTSDTTSSIRVNQAGLIKLTITDPSSSAQCSYTDSIHVYQEGVCLSVNEAFARQVQWIVYPNPARTSVQVSFTGLHAENCTLQLYNGQGQMVINENHEVSGGELSTSLALNDLPPGVYQLRCVTTKGEVSRKLVIE